MFTVGVAIVAFGFGMATTGSFNLPVSIGLPVEIACLVLGVGLLLAA